MAICKCKMCGGDLNITELDKVVECEYCGTTQTVPSADSEKKMTLFNRANRLRLNGDFDKAASIYENIVAEFPEEAEAYWGLVLCKYGIEYVDDPATTEKIPTCHRSSFDPVLEDDNFEQACENADAVARRVYRNEAKRIEEIRRGILEVSSKEEPYDIFICYKETDGNGDRTVDSAIAQDVYDALTEKGYRVFFSRVTLEDKLGQEYEPYIFAALTSANIMLVFGTDYEYFNAVWVKNEWSRFLHMIVSGQKKVLIPCYKDIDAYDMPKEFAKLQSQDMGKVGAIQDLLRGIGKILSPTESKPAEAAPQQTAPVSDALTKRGYLFIEDGDYKSADEYFERALDENPEDARAYVGKVLACLRIGSVDEIIKKLFENGITNKYDSVKSNLVKSIRFSIGEDKARVEAILDSIKEAHRKLEEKDTEDIKQEEKILLQHKKELMRVRKEFSSVPKLISSAVISPPFSVTYGLKTDGHIIRTSKSGETVIVPHISDIVALYNYCYKNIIGLRKDGRISFIHDSNYGSILPEMKSYISNWSDIVSLAEGNGYLLGLKSDGTVLLYDYNNKGEQSETAKWRGIVSIVSGGYHTLGLRADGTVLAAGKNNNGECNVSDWSDIIAIDACKGYSLGLRSDGTVLAAGKNYNGACDVSNWSNIVSIVANDSYSVGIRDDGTVVIAGNLRGRYRANGIDIINEWSDIVNISSNSSNILGLRADGTVVAVGDNSRGQCDVSKWTDIVSVYAGSLCSFGIRKNGMVVAAGANGNGQCNVTEWKLFNDYSNIESERK